MALGAQVWFTIQSHNAYKNDHSEIYVRLILRDLNNDVMTPETQTTFSEQALQLSAFFPLADLLLLSYFFLEIQPPHMFISYFRFLYSLSLYIVSCGAASVASWDAQC